MKDIWALIVWSPDVKRAVSFYVSDADSAASLLVSVETLVMNQCQFAAQVLISVYMLLNGLEASCLLF